MSWVELISYTTLPKLRREDIVFIVYIAPPKILPGGSLPWSSFLAKAFSVYLFTGRPQKGFPLFPENDQQEDIHSEEGSGTNEQDRGDSESQSVLKMRSLSGSQSPFTALTLRATLWS